jgi:predicted phosphoribosyltransferase
MIFEDRLDAAAQLAQELAPYGSTNPLVLAIPRGAVPMGRLIAQRLGGDLDVVLVRKLGSPFNPEYAIGAIDESGAFELSADHDFGPVTPEYLEREMAAQRAKIRARREAWGGLRAAIDPQGRTAIVVDDGLATGATMAAALRFLRGRSPGRIVLAVPVASPEGLARVAPLADAVVALAVPDAFIAVSQFYRRFAQIEDDEVAHLLAGVNHSPARALSQP